MLEIKIDAEDKLVTVHPTGALSKEDFSELTAKVNDFINTHDVVPNLLIVAKSFPYWDSFAAMLAHAEFVKGHQKVVRKVAIVGDGFAFSVLPSFADHFVSAKVRHFAGDKMEQARQWAIAEEDHPGAFELIEGLPSDVIAFKVRGTITSQDYKEMLTPLVEERLKEHDKLKVLAVFDEDFGSFTAGAMWDDARLGFMHYADFSKIAIVSDITWIRGASKFFSPLMAAQLHVFDLNQLEDAKNWLA